MMNSNQVRVVDPILTTVAQGYRQQDLVGDVLFPRVPVPVAGGRILSFGKEHFMSYNIRRSPGTDTKTVDFGYAGAPYACVQDSLDVPVPREFMRDASVQPGIDLGTRATRLGMGVITKSLEVEQAAIAFTAANYDSNHKVTLTSTAKWSDPLGKPTNDVDDAREAVRASIGVYPNVALLGALAFKAARNNPAVLDKFKYTSADSITEEMLAKLWNLEKVVVGKAVTADDAGAFTDVWGNAAVVAYAPQNPSGMEEPSYGYTYTLEGHPLVEVPWWNNTKKSWMYGVTMERVPVNAASGAAFLINTPN